jgi:hypothetical protein
MPMLTSRPFTVRLKIWAAALPNEPRLVALWLKTWQISKEGNVKDIPEEEHKFLCKNPPPSSLLHVCRESREVALKKFSLQIKTPTQKCPIFIDPLLDSVYPINTPQGFEAQLGPIRHLVSSIPLAVRYTLGPRCRGYPCALEQNWEEKIKRLGDLLRSKLSHLIDIVMIDQKSLCLLHMESLFRTLDFSHLKDLESGSLVGEYILALEGGLRRESRAYPEWKVPKYIAKGLAIEHWESDSHGE